MRGGVVAAALAVLAWPGLSRPAAGQSSGPEYEEVLHYTVNWPSGLSLGEGTMRTRRLAQPPGAREFTLVLDAAIPGVTVRDEYISRATADYCSIRFEKNSVHGRRKASETSQFDADRGVMVRTTPEGGGRSEAPIAACAKDALAFLHFLRREIASGRLPGAQPVYFGATYQFRASYGGVQALTIEGERLEADKLTATVKGPASETTFEIWLGRDEARTPLSIRVPFAMGIFSMELVR
jgi:hypothetical protein